MKRSYIMLRSCITCGFFYFAIGWSLNYSTSISHHESTVSILENYNNLIFVKFVTINQYYGLLFFIQLLKISTLQCHRTTKIKTNLYFRLNFQVSIKTAGLRKADVILRLNTKDYKSHSNILYSTEKVIGYLKTT